MFETKIYYVKLAN